MKIKVYLHDEEERKAAEARHAEIVGLLTQLISLTNQRSDQIMATIQQVQDDLDLIKQQSADYIAARDAIDVTLNATIADLTAQLAAGKADAATVQAGIDAAFQKAEDDKGLLVPPAAPAAS